MALLFRGTIHVSPHMFSTRERADHDWLLYCGRWQVGSVHENLRLTGGFVFVWSLTGPHTPEARRALRHDASSPLPSARAAAEMRAVLLDGLRR